MAAAAEKVPAGARSPVAKPARDVDHAARLAAEAEVLSRASVPGVVTMLGLEGPADAPVLFTARVDGANLSGAALGLDETAGVVAAVATVLADLHDLGIVHGAVMAEHVLVGPDGRPVLCGFGYSAMAGEVPLASAPLPDGAADPARQPGSPLNPASDVFALGALLRALVEAAPSTRSSSRSRPRPRAWRPGPTRGGAPARRPAPGARASTDALLAVADRATNPDPALRPSARSMAAAVGLAAPGARLPRGTRRADPSGPAAPDGGPPRPALPLPRRRLPCPAGPVTARARGRVARLVMVGGAVVAVALAAAAGVRTTTAGAPRAATSPPETRPGPPATGAEEPAVAAPTTGNGAASVSSAPPATGAVPSACPKPAGPPAALAADTDGDGCPEDLTWAGGVIFAGDRRWAVGRPGDQVAIADWSCSGRATVALLRPSTGEVFVFPGWAEAGHDLSADLAARVDGGFALRTAELGDGCPHLVVERSGGPPVTVAAPR